MVSLFINQGPAHLPRRADVREGEGLRKHTSGAWPRLPHAPGCSVHAGEATAAGSRGASRVWSRGSSVLEILWAPAPGSSKVLSSASAHSCLQDAGSLRVGTSEQAQGLVGPAPRPGPHELLRSKAGTRGDFGVSTWPSHHMTHLGGTVER